MKTRVEISGKAYFKLLQFPALIILGLFFLTLGAHAQPTIYNDAGTHTYTVPNGATAIKVQVWGGGGGGGSRTSGYGGAGGGGGGAYSSSIIFPVTPGESLTVEVGGGGSSGENGGFSRVHRSGTDLVLANGGSGGTNNSGGDGGTTSGAIGEITISGSNGGAGVSGIVSSGGDGGAAANTAGGEGTGGSGASGNSDASAGNSPGGGGGGGRSILFGGTFNAGNGANGRVIIETVETPEYWGSGSRDLYPHNAVGGRATLASLVTGRASNPFPTRGTHYVYVEEGEQIAMASSTQRLSGSTANRIRLYGPDGTQISHGNENGNIPNRAAELAGPRLPGQDAGGDRYLPIYWTAKTSGIYRVEFDGGSTSSDNRNLANIWATDDWSQGANTNDIMAWDVSVAKLVGGSWQWQTGRTYANVLNMDMYTITSSGGNRFVQNKGFHGKFKVLTSDGFVYSVDNNGNNGIAFTFMVNNKGFYQPGNPSIPSYKSILAASETAVTSRYHDPRTADNAHTVTHKIFYALPDPNMPATSIGAVPGGSTWLRTPEMTVEVDQIVVQGVEGIYEQVGRKGANLIFNHEGGANYTIIITPSAGGTSFPPRTIAGSTVMGENIVYWDGKDGAGNELPNGIVGAEVEIKLTGAEVHFPYIDMEINPNGIILELLNTDMQSVRSDRVFWDDTDIPNVSSQGTYGNNSNPKNASHTIFPAGTSSNSNGHRWGHLSTGHTDQVTGTFGDEKGIDTWTFIEGATITTTFDLVVKIADLYTELDYSVAGIPNKGSAVVGEQVAYTVKAGNMGPTDLLADNEVAKFSFFVPSGVDINTSSMPFTIDCPGGGASQHVPIAYDAATRTFNAELKLPAGCSITYTFTGTVNGTAGAMTAESTILRPNDVTDPDATNSDPQTPPTDPYFECYDNGLGGGCNNIQEVSFMVLPDCVDDLLYYEDFGRGYSFLNDGRQNWDGKNSISVNTNGDLVKNPDGTIQRGGPLGGSTITYSFAPGQHDPLYAAANAAHSPAISVARIKNGYYSVNPPGYTQIGIPETDLWHLGVWDPNAATNSPDIADSNYDWTQPWNATPPGIRDMSGNVRGNAYLIRGAASASQSIRSFYEFAVPGVIAQDAVYTVDLYSFVTYHDKDYLLIDVVDKNSGQIYATVPLKSLNPPSGNPTGPVFGWDLLTANFTFATDACDVVGKEVIIAIRGSQDRSLETGKGFGHTLIDNIMFSKRKDEANCDAPVTTITCVDDCFADIEGIGFGWEYTAATAPNNPLTETITQPGTDGGFILDLYKMDNSFNLIINGVKLYHQELEFESGVPGSPRNIRFKSDGAMWGEGGVSQVYDLNSSATIDLVDRLNNPTPAVRVIIDQYGNVKLYGKRTNNSSLEELEVFDSTNDNPVGLQTQYWYTDSSVPNANTVVVTQNVQGLTMIYGFGYGQDKKECETCEILKDGEFDDNNGDGFAQTGETITYTFTVRNLGDMDIQDLVIVDPLFGMNITVNAAGQPNQAGVTLTGNLNNDDVLDKNETWEFEVKYTVTHADIFTNRGVYNRAQVTGVGQLSVTQVNFTVDSFDPTPYDSDTVGWDATRPFHTYVPLRGKTVVITNPHIRQRVRNNE